MDLTTAVNSLGSDYVNKVSDLLTNKTNTASGITDDSSFDSVFNAVSGLLDSTNSYIQQAQQAQKIADEKVTTLRASLETLTKTQGIQQVRSVSAES